MDDDELFRRLGELLNGLPTNEVIPAMIVASARALVEDSQGNRAKLERQLDRFGCLLGDQALDMMKSERVN